MNQIFYLLKKEFQLEYRNIYSFFGNMLFIIVTIYLCNLIFGKINNSLVWNSLYWIIILFSSIQFTTRSFLNDSQNNFILYHTLTKPEYIILSKTIYNQIAIIALALLAYLFYWLLLGNMVENIGLFLIAIICGSAVFSAILSTMSAIATNTNNPPTLIAILSIPLLIPVLLAITKLSHGAIIDFTLIETWPLVILLLTINLMTLTMGYILFPYLWKE